MAIESPTAHSEYFYHASAYGLAAQIERPVRQSIDAQATATLASSGGRGAHSVGKISVDPFIYFDSAYTEVGGSFDECHNIHTTYAYAVVEGLNIADVVTADRVVSRMVSYSPEVGKDGEHSFDITGSHFDNLRIAGHRIELKLSTHRFNEHDTYSKFASSFHGGKADDLLPWGKQDKEQVAALAAAESSYHALKGIGGRANLWANRAMAAPQDDGRSYLCSAAGHLDLQGTVGKSELQGFGGIILIPKFGVVRLAEVIIHKDYRRLIMFRVQMCSGSSGSSDGGTTTTSGGRPPMP